jgi:N-acylneuraminate cytidylyltransferase
MLVVIPARGGSKGIPGKNTKLLAGRPLIAYAIDCARAVAEEIDICLSTDAPEIKQVAESEGLYVPFLRPDHLAEDTSGTYEVLLHALDYYAAAGQEYDDLLLLQPTSPLRRPEHVREAVVAYRDKKPEMLVSVKESSANPYYTLFEENTEGYLRKSKEADFIRRQDCPPAYEYNGAIYVINVKALREKPLYKMKQVLKFVMDARSSLDLDTLEDWAYLKFLLRE